MKSHNFIGVSFGVWFFIVACSVNNSATITTSQNAAVAKVVDRRIGRTLGCNKPNEYRFIEVQNPNRHKASDPVIPRDLHIVVGDEVISKIELPKESEVKNFSLNSVEKTKVGFEVRIDWGGNLNHYDIQFNFRCKRNKFYLYRVKKEYLSTTNPDSGNFWDKTETKVTRIPNLPIEKFVMINYLQWFGR